jgi:hypothetical protein
MRVAAAVSDVAQVSALGVGRRRNRVGSPEVLDGRPAVEIETPGSTDVPSLSVVWSSALERRP